jgi:ParB family chromosome partitioning protein
MSIQFIPLNKLIASPRNVRRKDRKADIEALAASIASHGLLQNLCVVPAEGERFEVDAGGRRLQALKLLAKTGVIARDTAIACNIVAVEDGREVSLTENVHRVAMDAMDEVDAFAALVADGLSADEVAMRFGVTRRHVDQRLALAGLSPKIKAAWKRGDVTLDAARAFCLVEDHAQQDAVYRSLGRPVTNAPAVRSRLMDGRVRASDRLAVFVGLDAYEAAGGKLLRDLFDTDAVFLDNPALLTKLAEEKLQTSVAGWMEEGWAWVETHVGDGRVADLSSTRLHPEWRDPSTDEQAELDRISGEIEKLDADLEASSVEDDPRWSTRDDLEAAYELVRQAGRCWTAEAKAIAGVLLSIGRNGEVSATEGLVRNDDEKQAKAYLKQRREGDAADSDADDEADVAPATGRVSALPKAVNRDLTLARTRAIRLRLSGDPDIALALCVAAMVQRSLHRSEMIGVSLSAQFRQVDDLPALQEAWSEMEGRLPEDETELLDWALGLSRERLLAVLACVVATSVDLAHEDTSPADLRRQAIADRLAQHLDIDMRQHWTPDLDFWVRLPKSTLLSELSEAPGVSGRSERSRQDLLKAHARLRKDELASKVAIAFDGTAYLPDILVTPVAAGALELTGAGIGAVQQPAVAAE